MTSSRQEQFWAEIEDLDAHIPEGKLEYLGGRLRNDLHDFVLGKFLEQKEKRGLTKAELARRIGYDSGRLNRLLGTPGNWTLKTVSDLLAGICGEALVPHSASVPNSLSRNMNARNHPRLESDSNPARHGSHSDEAGGCPATRQVQEG